MVYGTAETLFMLFSPRTLLLVVIVLLIVVIVKMNKNKPANSGTDSAKPEQRIGYQDEKHKEASQSATEADKPEDPKE